MSTRVAGCVPLVGATAQQPSEEATDTATLAKMRRAASALTGRELRAQLRAQQGRNLPAQAYNGSTPAVAPFTPEPTHYRWRVILPDGTPFEVFCLPELTLAEIRELYRGATARPMPDAAAGEAGQLPEQMPACSTPRAT